MIDTLIVTNVKLLLGQRETYSNTGRYHRLVEKLNYLTITRPYISFGVSLVSQFLNSHCNNHWDAMTHILRYITSSQRKRLIYEERRHTDIVGYTELQLLIGHVLIRSFLVSVS